ncbi:MAG TPA: hypothetical protein VIC08_04690 [Cellvibrionaceae bacterium]
MEDQTLAWLVYLAGTLVFGLVLWRFTRRWSRIWRHFVLVSYAVLALTPFSLQLQEPASAYAPALFIVVLNTLFQGWESALDAAIILVMMWILALFISAVYLLLTRRKTGGATTSVNTPASEP